eukprot:4103930-Prymnesium_polylepis.1
MQCGANTVSEGPRTALRTDTCENPTHQLAGCCAAIVCTVGGPLVCRRVVVGDALLHARDWGRRLSKCC